MKTKKYSKGFRLMSGTLATIMLSFSFTGSASARILFQDDTFEDVASEGILINDDDGGDEDVTIQLGNDGTDGTIIWDDGLSELQIGDGVDSISINSDTWDVSSAGVGSGFTGFTSTGTVNFSGSGEFRIREVADEAVAACTTVDEIVLDTTENRIYICTAAGAPGTWVGADSGSTQDFEEVYSEDANNDLRVDDNDANAFIIGEGANDYITINTTNGSEAVEIDQTLTANGVVNIGDGGDNVSINSSTWDISSAGAASGLTTIDASGNITTSAGDFIIGTTGLTETTSATDSGAFLVGVFDEFDNSNSANVQDVLDDIDAAIGDKTYTENNVIVDGESTTASLEKLDLQWGDLASTANGEGASMVGIEDAGALITATTVEGALAELAGNQIADGTAANNTLRWNGTDWVESSSLSNTGAAVSISDGTSFTTNGVTTIGDGGDNVSINSSTWDISSAGAASGLTTIDASGNITTSAGDFIIGTTGLTETTSATDSGAFLVGVFDEFDNSNSANVQDVLDDIDAAIGDKAYTENNVIVDGESTTASLEKLDLQWGDLASTANGEGASMVGIEDAGALITATTVEGALAELAGKADNNNTEITLEPEYPNTVVFEDGSNNRGRLEALYDDTNREHYYRWTTRRNASHDIDLRVRYELPSDFVNTGDLTLRKRTDTNVLGDNSVAIVVRNDTDNTTCHSDTAAAAAAAGAWETVTITAAEIGTGCAGGSALAAGDMVEIQIKMAADNTSSGGSDVGTLVHDYTN